MSRLVGHGGLPRPASWIPADTVIDIGAGIRPINWGSPTRHVCVEPYGPYAERLREAGYETVQAEALYFLRHAELDDAAVYLLDVIEHMDREIGEEVVAILQDSAAAQIVVFTPNGFMPQEGDAWGLGGEHWQKHRSGWAPADFPGWEIELLGNTFLATLTRRSK